MLVGKIQLQSSIFEWFGIGLLLLLGAWLRFAHFPNTLVWSNDSAREVMMAHHIATEKVWPTQGHFNTGTQSFYPPHHYYFLGLLGLLSVTPAFVAGVNIFFHTVSLICYYFLGKVTLGKKAGFLLMGVAAVSKNLIWLAQTPTPISWAFPLYLIALTLVFYWLQRQQFWTVAVAAVIGLISAQTHGTQLFLVGWIGVLLSGKILIDFRKKSGKWIYFLSLIVLIFSTMISQQLLVKSLTAHTFISASWSSQTWQTILLLAQQNTEIALPQLAIIGSLLLLLVAFLTLKKISDKTFSVILPIWWWFSLVYVISFEWVLSRLSTGDLGHHQFYVFPLWLLLLIGLMQVGLQACLKHQWLKELLLTVFGIFLASVLTFSDFNQIGASDSFVRTQELFHQLQTMELPLRTADVLMTTPNGGVNATDTVKVWWFLVTELDRKDLIPQTWLFQPVSDNALIICDEATYSQLVENCEQQRVRILQTNKKLTLTRQAICLSSGFQVVYVSSF
jgi:hypothetical protein